MFEIMFHIDENEPVPMKNLVTKYRSDISNIYLMVFFKKVLQLFKTILKILIYGIFTTT